MGLILLVILVVLLIAVLPTWPYSNAWGYRPTGMIGLILIIILILILAKIIVFWEVTVDSTDNKTTIKIERKDS